MDASVNMTKKSIAGKYIKRTAGIISNAAGSYISDAMPTTTSTLSEAKSTVSEAGSMFRNTTSSIMPKYRQLKSQITLKNINSWFLKKSDEFSDTEFDDSLFNFDIGDDDSSLSSEPSQLSETTKMGNQISKTVVESSQQLVESQITTTSNVLSSMEKEIGTIAAGFDKTNKTLENILEVLTKNTSALIEATVASNDNKSDPRIDMLHSGSFSLSGYKNIVKNNFSNSELGLISNMAKMALSMRSNPDLITPETIVSSLFDFGMNKFKPNLKKNLEQLDQSINNVIMNSLIRLGENRNSMFASIFGIDSSRKNVNTSKSSLELKSISFDTMTKEAITNTIPGYLREILKSLGGPDMIYDYRSRSFRSKESLKKEFASATSGGGALRDASDNIRDALYRDDVSALLYDLMMNDLSGKGYNGEYRKVISSLKDKKNAKNYINALANGIPMSKSDKKSKQEFINNLSNLINDDIMNSINIGNQVKSNEVKRYAYGTKYVENAREYNVDLSDFNDSLDENRKAIIDSYINNDAYDEPTISTSNPKGYATGINYTNKALYEIYRRLDTGINVFQVGHDESMDSPFDKFGNRLLPPPSAYIPKPIKNNRNYNNDAARAFTPNPLDNKYNDDQNLLKNQTLEDGTEEDLSTGKRVTRWAKHRGGDLLNALFSGSPEDVKNVFSASIRDISQIGGDKLKDKASTLNDKFGNISGYVKHKLFGKEYSYQTGTDDQGNAIMKNISKNEKGGIFGFVKDEIKGMFKSSSEKSKNWLSSVLKYFDYGDSNPNDPDDKKIASNRKKILSTSVGAFAGAGILGGPIGLLVGAVAGNALYANGIGKGLKERIFGRDDDGNATGMLTKISDAVLDPVKYEVSKTFHHFGNILKKNILGPLSDIGFAIKERVSNKAESIFGKVLDKLGNALLAPLKLGGKAASWIWDKVVSVGGTYTRTKGDFKTLGYGLAMEGAANVIAGSKESREKLNERRKSRNQEIKDDNKKFIDKDTWIANKHKQKVSRRKSFESYIKETEESPTKESNSNTSEIKDALSETNANVSLMAEKSSKDGINTHDVYTERKVDELINSMKHPGIKKTQTNVDSDNGAANSLMSIAGTMVMSGDGITSDEAKSAESIFQEGISNKPNKRSILSKIKGLMSLEKKKSDDSDNDKAKSKSWIGKIFDKLTGGIGGISNKIGIIATAVSGFVLGKELKSFWNDVIKGDDSISEWWGEKSIIGKGVNGLMDVSQFIARAGSPIVNAISKGIANVTRVVPGMPTISPPMIDADSPFAGIATASLGGLYFKGINAIASIISAGSNMAKNTSDVLSNVLNLTPKGGTVPVPNAKGTKINGSTIMEAASYAMLAKSLIEGPAVHDDTDAAGNEIVNYDKTRFERSYGTKNIAKRAIKATSKKADDLTYQATHLAIGVADDASKTKGAAKFAKNIVEKFKNFLMKNKHFSKYAKAISSKFDDILLTIGKNADSVIKKMPQKIASIITKGGTKEAAGIATAGIGYAVMAFGGALSGGLSAANIFGVRESDVDAKMRTIASVIVAAINSIPGVWALELVDLFISPLTFRSFVCQLLYNLMGGTEDLAEKQATLSADLNEYNEKYDTSLSIDEYNDMTNKGVMAKIFGYGGVKTDENGKALTDDAGEVLRTNHGIAGWFAGHSEKQYAKDENGNVLKDENGKAIQAVDANGNKIYKGNTIADNLQKFGHNITSFFTGKTTYKTDENGVALVDPETGEYIVDKKEGNVFQRLLNPLSMIIKGFSDSKDSDNLTDENGNPIEIDEASISSQGDAKWSSTKVTKNNIGDIVKKTLKTITLMSLNPLLGILQGVKLFDTTESPWKKQGKTLTQWIGGGISSIWNNITKKSTGSGGVGGPENNQSYSFGQEMLDEVNSSIAKNRNESTVSTSGGGSGRSFSVEDENSENSEDPYESQSFDPSDIEVSKNPLNKPWMITSNFGNRILGGKEEFHPGIDIVPTDGSGQADIGSNWSGTISSVKADVPDSETGLSATGTGNHVYIQTDDGYTVKFFHMKAGSIPTSIKEGERVEPGQKIGEMGTTGRSTGAHLHYQIEENGEPIDPNPFMEGNSSQSFTSNGETYEAARSSNSSKSSSSSSSTNSSSSKSKGPLAELISSLRTIGSAALSYLTGGLYEYEGDDSSESSSGSSSSSTISSSSNTTDDNVYSKYDGSIKSSDDFLKLVTNELGVTDGGNNQVKYNEWYYGKSVHGKQYPWKMTFVQWCFDQAGFTLPCRTDKSSELLKYYTTNLPDNIIHTDPKPGDIVIYDSSCGIVEKFGNGDKITIIEGNVDKHVNPSGARYKKTDTCVARTTINRSTTVAVIIRPVDFEELAEVKSSSISPSNVASVSSADNSVESLWKYFKSLGYSDNAIAGILGCWTSESSNKSDAVEGYYNQTLQDKLAKMNPVTDRDALDDYAQSLFNVYDASSVSYNKGGYIADDGHYYPGLGFAQWTGQRAKNLLDFARDNNLDWSTPATQLAFLNSELETGYGNVFDSVNGTSTPESAADTFCRSYEGYNRSDGIAVRQSHARSIYNQFAGKYDESGNAIGGPVMSKSKISKNTNRRSSSSYNDFSIGNSNNIINTRIGKRVGGIGGPNEVSSNLRKSTGVGGPNESINNSNVNSYEESSSGYTLPSSSKSNPITPSTGGKITDLSQVIHLLNQILESLTGIDNNTKESSSLLDSINNKDFSNTQYTNTSRINRGSKKSFSASRSSGTSARTVSGMARPKFI